MREQLDPKELKTLSDILALVLEDQPGQAASALEAVRARARRNGVTGGALKNLFVALVPNPPPPKAPRASRARSGTASSGAAAGTGSATELQASRVRISHLSAEVNRLDLDLRGAHARVEALRSELQLTRQARAEAQQALLATQHSAPRRIMLLITALCGLLIGIAGASAVISFDRTEAANQRIVQ